MKSDYLKNAYASRSAATATLTLPCSFGHAVGGRDAPQTVRFWEVVADRS